MHSSYRTTRLARHFLYLPNRAAAISAFRFQYEWCTNCNKIGPSPGIFLDLFHSYGVSVQVLSSGIMANPKINIVENGIQQCSNMFTTSTSSGFAITPCTKNIVRDLAKSNNSGIASSGLERWLENTKEETMLSVVKPGGNPTIRTWSSRNK